MDLLGRKARRLLAARTARLDAALQLAYSQERAIADLSGRLHSRESLVRDLLSENAILDDQARVLAERCAHLEGMIAAVPAPPEPQQYRVSEEEQEVEWQLKQGIIDAQEYEHLLRELDFQNANIEIDPDYSPRPELTY